MTGWLAGRRVLVIGGGNAADVVLAAGAAAGATCDQQAEWHDAIDMTGVDALVHAGVPAPPAAAVATDLAAWRAAHSADLDGRFLATAALARAALAARRPAVVLMLAPAAGDIARMTANGGIDNLVKSLAVEWARDGIRINAIISRHIAADGAVAPAAQATLGHLATWLLSDFAGYVSGSIIGIDETADATQ
jgi:NAD(P)-dependent dehydrogenase (short-subunit alcohol dehydrogenase family)